MKKQLVMLLVLAMLASCLVFAASAAEATDTVPDGI